MPETILDRLLKLMGVVLRSPAGIGYWRGVGGSRPRDEGEGRNKKLLANFIL
jgi:hypothetical protein